MLRVLPVVSFPYLSYDSILRLLEQTQAFFSWRPMWFRACVLTAKATRILFTSRDCLNKTFSFEVLHLEQSLFLLSHLCCLFLFAFVLSSHIFSRQTGREKVFFKKSSDITALPFLFCRSSVLEEVSRCVRKFLSLPASQNRVYFFP